MFIYQAWGVDADDEERYRNDFAVAGQRLLAHKEQLLNFLCGAEAGFDHGGGGGTT